MKQRGKKSVVAVATDLPISAVDRPEPPVELTPEQRLEWITVVNSLRADWFPPETHGILAQYCKHAVAAKHLGQWLTKLEDSGDLDVGEYDKLLKMQERESRAMLALARSMRLTQQASYHPDKLKDATTKGRKPWES